VPLEYFLILLGLVLSSVFIRWFIDSRTAQSQKNDSLFDLEYFIVPSLDLNFLNFTIGIKSPKILPDVLDLF